MKTSEAIFQSIALFLFMAAILVVTSIFTGCGKVDKKETCDGLMGTYVNDKTLEKITVDQNCSFYSPVCMSAYQMSVEPVDFVTRWPQVVPNSTCIDYHSGCNLQYDGLRNVVHLTCDKSEDYWVKQ